MKFKKFHEKYIVFTFGEYSLIWGKSEKNENFSFVLKVNRKKLDMLILGHKKFFSRIKPQSQ